MSRGPGVWQRHVLAAIAAENVVTVVDVWHHALSVDSQNHVGGSTLTRGTREAIQRAIRTLTARGEIASNHDQDSGALVAFRPVTDEQFDAAIFALMNHGDRL